MDGTGTFALDLAAGAAASLVGMVSFGVFHTLWIRNIPAVFVEGVLYAIPSTLGLTWLIRVTRRAGWFRGVAGAGASARGAGEGRFSGDVDEGGIRGGDVSGRESIAVTVRRGTALGFLLWLTLIPYEVVGAAWGPWDQQGVSFAAFLPLLWIAFLGAPVGGAAGWILTRRLEGVLAWAVAALTVDFSLGGGIAFEGGRGTFLGLFLWLLPTHVLAGVVLVGMASLPTGRAPRLEDAPA